MTRSRTCKKKNGTIYEAFYDGKSFQAKHAGPIFCSTMNGYQISFPETYDDFKTILDYQANFLDHKNMGYMETVMNAFSYAAVPEKPDIGYPPGGYFDIYEMGTKKLLNVEEKVKKSISKDHHSYQSKEELCYLMRNHYSSKPPDGFDSETAWFITQRCNRFMHFWAMCTFDRKIFVKVSGLCTFSPVDKVYTLMEPEKSRNDRIGTFSGNS